MSSEIRNLPSISIAIPTFNEERNIKRCLDSIFRQSYPKELLEIFIIDDYSKDKTVEIAGKYPVNILFNGSNDGEVGKLIAFKQAKGDFFIYFDADVELVGKNWFQRMLFPLEESSEIVASFTRKYSKKTDSALERYYCFDALQRDPIYEFFSPKIEDTIIERRHNYRLCLYREGKIPPAGRCLYRRQALLSVIKEDDNKFPDLDVLVRLVQAGYVKFAYVPEVGLYHHHVKNLKQLLKKRARNVRRVYLTSIEKKQYKWFDLSRPKDVFKIILWVIYANLFFPALIRGFYRFFKFRDVAAFYEPVVTLLVTDVIIWNFLRDKNSWKLFRIQ